MDSSHIENDLERLQQDAEGKEFFMDRIMRWYAKQLLRPVVKVVVVIVFLACLGLNVYSTTKLEQQFNIEGKQLIDVWGWLNMGEADNILSRRLRAK